jgi:short-subunit dehydrogenase
MSADEMVEAALAGLDQGEVVTIPGLQDEEEWIRWEAARRDMSQRLSTSTPAPRYRTPSREAAELGR